MTRKNDRQCHGCATWLGTNTIRYRSAHCSRQCHDQHQARYGLGLNAAERLAARRARKTTAS